MNHTHLLATSIENDFMAERSYILAGEVEVDLQSDENTAWQKVLVAFKQKGGTLIRVGSGADSFQKNYQLQPGDAVYPVCSGGFCRSQTLWSLLRKYADKMVLFPPHAARLGFDPYNGQVNWHRNDIMETWYDEFEQWAQIPKANRCGFDVFASIHPLETVSQEELKCISEYYNEHYFGPQSSWQGQKGNRRVFITFDKNTHVVLHRLIQANDNLNDVEVVHLAFADLVTHPLPEWNTFPRSVTAYENFSQLINELIDCSLFKE